MFLGLKATWCSDCNERRWLTVLFQGGNCCTGVGLKVANGGAGGVVKAADLWHRVFPRFMGWGPMSLGLGLGLPCYH
ncbi:hypothetical protein RchiOBHm_Chr7g0207881 [Rosa chinensis]|uniref:Uncharacterized protein n=1 Tax=Rosa chinensis TaxID=74649 RepID=A0A2P6P9J1_ROSCH|nr:hypothetical protein RchiOBHm_Chr7g0207881 [Rosa chinensis]